MAVRNEVVCAVYEARAQAGDDLGLRNFINKVVHIYPDITSLRVTDARNGMTFHLDGQFMEDIFSDVSRWSAIVFESAEFLRSGESISILRGETHTGVYLFVNNSIGISRGNLISLINLMSGGFGYVDIFSSSELGQSYALCQKYVDPDVKFDESVLDECPWTSALESFCEFDYPRNLFSTNVWRKGFLDQMMQIKEFARLVDGGNIVVTNSDSQNDVVEIDSIALAFVAGHVSGLFIDKDVGLYTI